jgi:copper transport protein
MINIRRVLAATATALLAILLLPAAPAAAHAALVATSPAQGSTVPSAPSEVTLTFSESVTPVTGKIRVIAPDGSRADRGTPTASGTVLRIPLRGDAPIGTYLVSYRVISADSHPVPGGFTFNVGAPSASGAPQAIDEGTADRLVTTAIPVFKYLGYAGLLLIAGPALIMLLLWPARLSRRGPRRLLALGIGLVALSTAAGFVLQAPYINGKTLADTTGADLLDVLNSQYGAVMLARLGILAVAAIVLPAAVKRAQIAGEPARSDLAVLAILGVVGVTTWPLVGHSAGSPMPAVTVVVDTIHLVSMAVWLGGLAVLAAFLLRPVRAVGLSPARAAVRAAAGGQATRQDTGQATAQDTGQATPSGPASERELAAILPVWSRWATLAVSALLLAGVVQALIEIGSIGALVTTTYGLIILIKAGLVALVLAFASFARRSTRTAPAGTVLRRAVRTELAIAAVVLGFSAVLTQTTPARVADTAPNASRPAAYFSTTATTSLYTLQVEVDPAKAGENGVHLYAYTSQGKPLKVVEWAATAALPGAGIEPIAIPLLPLTDNHASGSINLPSAGSWQMRVTVRTTEVDQEATTVTVPVG